ncbi:MAG TPA: dihydrodipicolinate synthase family protein [Stellaceae bacterium]|nr:dihydrodipicolinate synthase family protein [Stellaceae bacterium]
MHDYMFAKYEGLFIPTVTPFDPRGELDLKSLDRVARYQASIPGVAGIVSCARIGEGTVLGLDEKMKVYETMGAAARAHGKVHTAAIAPQSTREAIGLIRALETMPVDAVMIFPPLLFAWGKVGGDLKVRFYEDIVNATAMPITLFQIPVANYWYDPDTICRIAALKHVVSFKEASFNVELFTETCRRLKQSGLEMRILTGNDRFVGKSYELGAVGALIGMANVAPDQWAALDRAGRAGQFDRALALQHELAPLSDLIFAEPIVEAVARIKAVLKNEGLIAHDTVRPPQMGIAEAERTELLKRYAALRAKTNAKLGAVGD